MSSAAVVIKSRAVRRDRERPSGHGLELRRAFLRHHAADDTLSMKEVALMRDTIEHQHMQAGSRRVYLDGLRYGPHPPALTAVTV